MSIIKKILIGTGVLTVVLFILGGIGLYLLTQSPSMEDEIRPVEADAEDIQSFDRKIAVLENEIKAAAVAGEQREVILILTEAEVSIALGEMMGEAITEASDEFSEEMIIDAVVNLDDDMIRAIVGVEMAGIKIEAGVELIAEADEDELALKLDTFELGKLPFSGLMADRIKHKFNESHTHISLDDLHIDLENDLPVELTGLAVNNGEMIIKGVTT